MLTFLILNSCIVADKFCSSKSKFKTLKYLYKYGMQMSQIYTIFGISTEMNWFNKKFR